MLPSSRFSRPSSRRHRALLLTFAAVAGAIGGCRALTESPQERACRQLNAFTAATAQLRVGQTRQFEAAGFQPGGASATTCVGTIRGDFQYGAHMPAVATVEATTGLVTAQSVGITALRARWRVNGTTHRGVLTLHVLP